MTPSKPTVTQKVKEDASVPFDEALRRLVNAPPQHKPAKKPAPRKPQSNKPGK